jgi:hypothetical protein
LIIDPAPLTVWADNKVRQAGQPDPRLTASYSGFVNGDGPSSLTSPAVLSTTTTAASPAGAYPITVGGAASPNYRITLVPGMLTVTAPPPVTISTVRELFNKKHQVTQILVTFSGPVDAAEAQEVGLHRLTAAGKKGSFTAMNAKVIRLKSAAFNSATDTVTLTLIKPFALSNSVQLKVNGSPPSGLEDTSGLLIDGNHDGQPGGNAVAVLGRGGATISAVVYQVIGPFLSVEPSAVDVPLEQQDTISLRLFARAKHLRR